MTASWISVDFRVFGISLPPLAEEHLEGEMGFDLISIGSSVVLWAWPCIGKVLISGSRRLAPHKAIVYIFLRD